MNPFGDYTIGSGTCEIPNLQAQSLLAAEMRRQGLTQMYSAFLSPMTFRLMEQKSATGTKYWIEYKGR